MKKRALSLLLTVTMLLGLLPAMSIGASAIAGDKDKIAPIVGMELFIPRGVASPNPKIRIDLPFTSTTKIAEGTNLWYYVRDNTRISGTLTIPATSSVVLVIATGKTLLVEANDPAEPAIKVNGSLTVYTQPGMPGTLIAVGADGAQDAVDGKSADGGVGIGGSDSVQCHGVNLKVIGGNGGKGGDSDNIGGSANGGAAVACGDLRIFGGSLTLVGGNGGIGGKDSEGNGGSADGGVATTVTPTLGATLSSIRGSGYVFQGGDGGKTWVSGGAYEEEVPANDGKALKNGLAAGLAPICADLIVKAGSDAKSAVEVQKVAKKIYTNYNDEKYSFEQKYVSVRPTGTYEYDATWYTDAEPGVGLSEENPYILYDVADLRGLEAIINGYDGFSDGSTDHEIYDTFRNKFVKLADSFDDATPMTEMIERFEGTFDGNCKNIVLDMLDDNYSNGIGGYMALFNTLDNATVKNLMLSGRIRAYDEYEHKDIDNPSSAALALSVNNSRIISCASTVSVGTGSAGRLIRSAASTVMGNCYAVGELFHKFYSDEEQYIAPEDYISKSENFATAQYDEATHGEWSAHPAEAWTQVSDSDMRAVSGENALVTKLNVDADARGYAKWAVFTNVNNGYPVCGYDWYTAPVGNDVGSEVGSEENPYLLYNTADLESLAYLVNKGNDFKGKHFKLADGFIDATPLTTAIGTDPKYFKGSFDGNGKHVVLDISGSSSAGMFGTVYEDVIIKNLTTSGTVSGKGNVGGIVGAFFCYNAAAIINCGSTAAVHCDSNSYYVGGIVGVKSEECVLKNCYHVGKVEGTNCGCLIGCLNDLQTNEGVSHCFCDVSDTTCDEIEEISAACLKTSGEDALVTKLNSYATTADGCIAWEVGKSANDGYPTLAGSYAAASLSLVDSINLNIVMCLPKSTAASEAKRYRIESFFNRNTFTNAAMDTTKDGTHLDAVSGTEYYEYRTKVAEAFSFELSKPVKVKIYYDGHLVKTVKYTASDYCRRVIDSSGDGALVELCKCTLDYGAEAQKYFEGRSYYTSGVKSIHEVNQLYLANAVYDTLNPIDACFDRLSTARSGKYTSAKVLTRPTQTASYLFEDLGLENLYASLILADKTAIKFYFETSEMEYGYQDFRQNQNGLVSEGHYIPPITQEKNDHIFSCIVTGISPLDLKAGVTLSIEKGEVYKGENWVSYSPYAYANTYWDDAELGSLVRTLVNYGDAALAYHESLQS